MFSEGPIISKSRNKELFTPGPGVTDTAEKTFDRLRKGILHTQDRMEGVTEQREDEEDDKRVSTTREVDHRGAHSALLDPVPRIELETKIEPFYQFEEAHRPRFLEHQNENYLNSYKSKNNTQIAELFSDLKPIVGFKRNHETMSQSHDNNTSDLHDQPIQTTKSHEHGVRTPERSEKKPIFAPDLNKPNLANGSNHWTPKDNHLTKHLPRRPRANRKNRKRSGRRATVANHEIPTQNSQPFEPARSRRASGKRSPTQVVEDRARKARISNKVEKIRRFWNSESLLIPNVFKLFSQIPGDWKNLLEFQDLSRKELLGTPIFPHKISYNSLYIITFHFYHIFN